MFHRIGDAAIKKDLTNIRKLCTLLGEPHQAFDSIHIAGTNGKGSTSHMMASVFQAMGLRVGLYTSPHYVDFRERIRINGEMIGQKEVVRFVRKNKEDWQDIQPSFFEITVAMAFDHFRNQQVDLAVIETGLGGRLDSTNIITPRLSMITNIGFDHMALLGHTLPAIAFEKAGIIKKEVPVVIGEWNKETAPVFRQKAQEEHAPISFASRRIRMQLVQRTFEKQTFGIQMQGDDYPERITTDLTGPYQKQNLATVLESIRSWNQHYPERRISGKAIRKGLSSVKMSTGMIGRWMILQRQPLVVTDAAHNVHGMKAMLPELLSIPSGKKHFVLGFVADKDLDQILSLFPKNGLYYWCEPDLPRAKPSAHTQHAGSLLNLHGEAWGSVLKAYKAAMREAGKKDLVFVGGSSYVVGEFLAGMKKKTGG